MLHDGLTQEVNLLGLYSEVLLLFLEVEKLQLRGLETGLALSLVIRKRLLLLGDLFRDHDLHVLELVLIRLDLGLLQRPHSLVLLQFLLIEGDVDLELFPLVHDLVSLFLQLLEL